MGQLSRSLKVAARTFPSLSQRHPLPALPPTSILGPRRGPPASPTWRQSNVLPVQLPPFPPHGPEAAPPGSRQASLGGQPAPSRRLGRVRWERWEKARWGLASGTHVQKWALGHSPSLSPRKRPPRKPCQGPPGRCQDLNFPWAGGGKTDRDWLLSDQAWPSPPSPP